jgi:glycosyltransferase involved in cell wall biosynthesis
MNSSSRMRVMMIGPFPASPERVDGGVAAALMYLANALSLLPEIELIGVRIGQFNSRDPKPLFSWPILDLPLGRMSLSTLYRRQEARLTKLIRQYQPDIVHAQGADVAGFLATRCGVPSVVTIHGLLGECAKFQSDPLAKARAVLSARLTERRTIRRAKDVIAISPYVMRYYGGQIMGRVHEIPNAVGPGYFAVNRSPERGCLLFAGRIANGKGLEELLRAVARNRAYVHRLVLAGATPDASYGEKIRNLAKDLGLSERVVFAGLLDESQLLREFCRAEALVLPSHQETAPMVIQQAMAAGLAVIATRVGGIPTQVDEGATGLLFDAGDVAQLSDTIARIGSDTGLADRLGTAARAVAADRYQSSAVARATAAVYQTIVTEFRSRPGRHQ